MNRTNIILAVILAAQIVIGVVIVLGSGSDVPMESGPLLADFNADSVTSITVTNANENTIRLERENGTWVLPDYGSYPVRESSVNDLLTKVADLEASRLIARSSSSHRRLGVASDDFERRVTLNDDTHLYIGTSGGANAAHMRVDGSDQVYLTSGLSAWELNTQVSSWIDTLYFNIEQENIVEVTVENQNGLIELVKTGEEWTLVDIADDETLNSDEINTLLGRVTAVRMREPLGTDYETEQPLAMVTITTRQPLVEDDQPDDENAITETLVDATYTLTIGEKIEDSDYVLKSSNSEYYVLWAEFNADNILNLTREDLLVTEETTEESP